MRMYRMCLPLAVLALVAGCMPEESRTDSSARCNGDPRIYSTAASSGDTRPGLLQKAAPAAAPNRLPDLSVARAPGSLIVPPAADTPPAVTVKLPPTPAPVPAATLPPVTTANKPPAADPDLVAATAPAAKPGPLAAVPARPADQEPRLPERPDLTTPPSGKAEAATAAAKEPAVRVLNGKRLRLGYQVKANDNGELVPVELWYTRDGKTWHRDDGPPQVHSPYLMDLPAEGVYGLTLVPCKAGTRESRPPQPGEPPQFWVAADWTRPLVTVQGVTADPVKNTVAVRWSARDDYLAGRPITLSWAEQLGGPWTPLAANLPNSGSYNGALPARMPPRFYVRVEASDQAGNVGESHTGLPVTLELPAAPKVEIVAVEVVAD
jgi:hypothetical protein